MVSGPGAGRNALASQNVLNDLENKKIEKIAIMGGTNDLVERDGSDGNFNETEKKKRLVTL